MIAKIRVSGFALESLCVPDYGSHYLKDPREFWKGLYELDNTSTQSSLIPLLVKNGSNQLVGGSAASQVWMDSFAKLGLENSDFNDYNVDFYYQIKQAVSQFHLESMRHSFVLD